MQKALIAMSSPLVANGGESASFGVSSDALHTCGQRVHEPAHVTEPDRPGTSGPWKQGGYRD